MMSTFHKVAQGEYLAKIAAKYGFADGTPIWGHAKNKQLAAKRKNPNVLFPGDIVFIPDKQEKEQGRATAQTHPFTVPTRTLLLRLVVKNVDGKPVANAKCVLEAGDTLYTLSTDGEGMIEKEIALAAERGKLTLQGEKGDFLLKIGHLDPAEEPSGWQSRLKNLGYYDGPLNANADDPDLHSAIEEFQCDHDLSVDGVCGPTTQAKLREVHGC